MFAAANAGEAWLAVHLAAEHIDVAVELDLAGEVDGEVPVVDGELGTIIGQRASPDVADLGLAGFFVDAVAGDSRRCRRRSAATQCRPGTCVGRPERLAKAPRESV
jgi:hypothetical protein